jgi:hypothetical protein
MTFKDKKITTVRRQRPAQPKLLNAGLTDLFSLLLVPDNQLLLQSISLKVSSSFYLY